MQSLRSCCGLREVSGPHKGCWIWLATKRWLKRLPHWPLDHADDAARVRSVTRNSIMKDLSVDKIRGTEEMKKNAKVKMLAVLFVLTLISLFTAASVRAQTVVYSQTSLAGSTGV